METDILIENALKAETTALAMGADLDENDSQLSEPTTYWHKPGGLSSPTLKLPGKGILLTRGFRKVNIDEEGFVERRKSVKFADGIAPGEGTSPSGGEELSSPPPFKPTSPREKRFKKIKKKKLKTPKKKKIKVKIIRKPNDSPDDEDLESLPPPSPPPGSPPPHVFPARVKSHTINNIHATYASSVPFLPIGTYQQQYRPTLQPLNMPPPHGPPHGPPHHPPHGPPHPPHIPPPHHPPHHPHGPRPAFPIMPRPPPHHVHPPHHPPPPPGRPF